MDLDTQDANVNYVAAGLVDLGEMASIANSGHNTVSWMRDWSLERAFLLCKKLMDIILNDSTPYQFEINIEWHRDLEQVIQDRNGLKAIFSISASHVLDTLIDKEYLKKYISERYRSIVLFKATFRKPEG